MAITDTRRHRFTVHIGGKAYGSNVLRDLEQEISDAFFGDDDPIPDEETLEARIEKLKADALEIAAHLDRKTVIKEFGELHLAMYRRAAK